MPSPRPVLPILALCLSIATAASGAGADDLIARPRPTLTATSLEAAPEVDGHVLDDEQWRGVPAVTDFWQATPDTGAPASEQTEVRVAYTKDTLFVAVVCHDR